MLRGLVKLSSIELQEETPEERADRRLRKYRSVQESKPDAGQMLRYSGVGAGLGLLGTAIENTVKGKPERLGEYVPAGSTRSGKHIAKAVLGRALGAAATVGLAPVARHWLDNRAAEADLRKSLAELQPTEKVAVSDDWLRQRIRAAAANASQDRIAEFATNRHVAAYREADKYIADPLKHGMNHMIRSMQNMNAGKQAFSAMGTKKTIADTLNAFGMKADADSAVVKHVARVGAKIVNTAEKATAAGAKLTDSPYFMGALAIGLPLAVYAMHKYVGNEDDHKGEHKDEKVAFETSAFSGPLSYGAFPQASGIPDPGSASQLLRTTNAKALQGIPKVATPTTIGGWARKARSVGAPRVSELPGRSIADQIKPEGPKSGLPMPGAKKGGVV